MLQSLIVYSLIIVTLFFSFGVRTRKMKNNLITVLSPLYKYKVWFGVLLFTFFSAVRWDVGIDYLSYLNEYMSIFKNGFSMRQDFEVGYLEFQKLLVKLGAHFTVYFAIVSFAQIFFTLSFFKREKYLLPFLGILIMCGGDYFSWMNGMRQMLVGTCFLFIVSLTIERRRIFLYVIAILLLSFIHKSAIFLLPFCLLYYLDLEKIYVQRKIQYLLFVGVLLLSSFSLWENLLSLVDVLFASIDYENRYNSEVLLRIGERDMSFGPRRIIFFIIDICIIYYSKTLRQTFSTKIFGFTHLIYILFFAIQPIFMKSLAFSRIVSYFYISRALMCSYLLFYLFQYSRTKKNVMMGAVILFLFFLHLFIQIYADEGNHTDCIRYQFFWNYGLLGR